MNVYRNIAVLLSFLCLSFSHLAMASTNYNPKFEFGTAQCSNDILTNGCKIVFNNHYDKPPLVFIMPTINAGDSQFDFSSKNAVTELPSSVRVIKVASTDATIKQFEAPHNHQCRYIKISGRRYQCTSAQNKQNSYLEVKYQKKAMTSIDYFVMEPGVINLENNVQIVAGEVSTNKAFSAWSHRNTNGVRIKYSDYGGTDFAATPGILVEPQTTNNVANGQPTWITGMALLNSHNKYHNLDNKRQFTLALERSETGRNDLPHNEKVAFVAGLGSGYVSGLKFWLGSARTKNTLGIKELAIQPVEDGCSASTDFSSQGIPEFKATPVLIASKNSREGPNGGWLRRCNVTKDQVSFIVEEDVERDSERSHHDESAAFFIFEKPNQNPVCTMFPSAVQTWRENANVGSLSFQNISNKIISTPINNKGERVVGFKPSKIQPAQHSIGHCYDDKSDQQGAKCVGDIGFMANTGYFKLPNKTELETFFKPSPNYANVTISKDQICYQNSACTPLTGPVTYQANEQFGNLQVVNSGTVIFKSGTYWIQNLTIEGTVEVPVGQKVILHVKNLTLRNQGSLKGLKVGSKKTGDLKVGDLLVYAHDDQGSPIHIDSTIDNAFTGLLYSEKNVEMTNNSSLYGAVTAKNVQLSGAARIIASEQECFLPPVEKKFKLNLTKKVDSALSCEHIPLYIQVTDEDGKSSSEYHGNIEVKTVVGVRNDTNLKLTHGEYVSGNLYKPDLSGRLDFYLTKAQAGNVTINTQLTEHTNQGTVSGHYSFVNDLQIDAIEVIAGKQKSVELRPKTCENGKTVPYSNFLGSKDFTIGSLSYIAPDKASAVHKLPLYLDGKEAKLKDSITLNFTKDGSGVKATLPIRYSEAGQVSLPLTHKQCQSKTSTQCVDQTMTVNVKARPWTFAICPMDKSGNNTSASGSANDGSGYQVAGKEFAVQVKPITWQSNGSESADIIQGGKGNSHNYPDYCGSQVTQNYLNDKTRSELYLNYTLASPQGGDIGTLSNTDKVIISPNIQNPQAFEFEHLTWDNVGSLKLSVSNPKINYLGMLINTAERSIGRFYPEHFKIVSPYWNYPNLQTFAYMGQPIRHGFKLQAQALNGQAVSNYDLFSHKAEFAYAVMKKPGTAINLQSRVEATTHAGVTSNGSSKIDVPWNKGTIDVAYNRFILKRNYPDPLYPNKSVEDGPYQSDFGVMISKQDQDQVKFLGDREFSAFRSQPDFRYGRMKLEDNEHGDSGVKLDVPVKVEYWDVDHFVTNTKDMSSTYRPYYYCWELLSGGNSSKHSTSYFAGALSDTMLAKQGSFPALSVTQTGNRSGEKLTEESRLFLLLTNTVPKGIDRDHCSKEILDNAVVQPWLLYNWRDKGDESPHTTVTFGIERGNDRVLFRGEHGLTGL